MQSIAEKIKKVFNKNIKTYDNLICEHFIIEILKNFLYHILKT